MKQFVLVLALAAVAAFAGVLVGGAVHATGKTPAHAASVSASHAGGADCAGGSCPPCAECPSGSGANATQADMGSGACPYSTGAGAGCPTDGGAHCPSGGAKEAKQAAPKGAANTAVAMVAGTR